MFHVSSLSLRERNFRIELHDKKRMWIIITRKQTILDNLYFPFVNKFDQIFSTRANDRFYAIIISSKSHLPVILQLYFPNDIVYLYTRRKVPILYTVIYRTYGTLKCIV